MTNANEPAYPVVLADEASDHSGLTKREVFAKAAMQGLLAQGLQRHELGGDATFKWYASRAVYLADALLAELENGK